MKRNRIITTLLVVCMSLLLALGLTACMSQEDVDNAVTPSSEQITTINTTLTEMQTLDTALDGYVDTLQTKVAALETDLSMVNTTLESLEEISATKTALLETKTALETEINSIKESITVLKAKDAELDGKITSLQTALSTEITDTERWIEETFATKTACDTLKTEINTSISTLQGKIDGLETSVETLNTAVTALQTQAEENKTKIEELEIIINCLEGNHVLNSVDNNDGKHISSCQHCDYSAIEKHSCTAVDNGDGTHTGTCVCGAEVIEEHSASSTTGACLWCNAFVAAASITVDGVKTYYATFDEAIAYANGQISTIIVIENDCDIMDMWTEFTSGRVTIDLNGKVIGSTCNYSICVSGATVTICDSVGGGKILELVGCWSGSLIIEGGTYEKSVNATDLVISNGNFADVGITTGWIATISGGSFETISIHSNAGTFADILADGYCFYDQDGNAVDVSTIQIDEYGWYYLYNITVAAIGESSPPK